MATPELAGCSLIVGVATVDGGAKFFAYNPANGQALEPAYISATLRDVDLAVKAAQDAADFLASSSGADRARLLRAIAVGLDAAAETLIERAMLETALTRPRLAGEVARTSGQMRLFARVAEEGSWLNARIDEADPGRTPPKPDVRSMLRPLFGASNFPLAFSVAGGDTASALAAGNPVIVKAHPAHPATGELVGHIVNAAVAASGFPKGTFALLFDAGHEIGSALVQHPGVKAVGFTGSLRGGRALMDLAAARPEPIPVYAEMGSTNPVFILPGALAERSAAMAEGLQASFTMAAGQLCTKPGMVFVDEKHSAAFTETLRSKVTETGAFTMLTQGIATQFRRGIEEHKGLTQTLGLQKGDGFAAQSVLFEVSAKDFFADDHLSEELFGPSTLLVHCDSREQMIAAARGLEGHLTASILGTSEDLADNAELIRILEQKAGRVIFNGFPTGVEVNDAMVHGGPYPATSDGRSTSVGSMAILRFARPVAYQNLPQFALPPELQDANSRHVPQLVNGKLHQPV
jgi:alpha-ketoglutaric semialdehyde dehydrogenase